MILKSDKILLRPLDASDIDLVHQWRNDKELRLLAIMHPFPVTMEQDKQWLTQILTDTSNKHIFFAAQNNETNSLFGYFQLMDINFIHRHAFLGIVIGDIRMRGKGLGKEMMKLGLNYGFNCLGLHKISLDVLEINHQAIKLYNSLGFSDEGRFVNQFFFDGQWYNIIRMSIII